MGANVEGPVGTNLTDVLKRVCATCNTTQWQIADQVANPGAGEIFYIMCRNGHEFSLDLENDMGALENYSD
jgi:hypothetical protein